MIKRLFTITRGINKNLELSPCFALTYVFIKLFWSQSSFNNCFGMTGTGADNTLVTIINIKIIGAR